MVKITNVPQLTYCKIQRAYSPGIVKVECTFTREWKEQIHKFYNLILRDDFTIHRRDTGVVDIFRAGYNTITLYPEEFQKFIFT